MAEAVAETGAVAGAVAIVLAETGAVAVAGAGKIQGGDDKLLILIPNLFISILINFIYFH
ncbi:MAG TPA: hypothetical protein VIL99_05770 [Ignavibacteria bacterium]